MFYKIERGVNIVNSLVQQIFEILSIRGLLGLHSVLIEACNSDFVHATSTAVIAYISKTPVIVIHESGQGTLGPVLVNSDRSYPDYPNHPTFH